MAAPSLGAEELWYPSVILGGGVGTSGGDGTFGLFVPLLQSPDGLVFAGVAIGATRDGPEGSLGFGIRHIQDAGWILGAHSFLDIDRTAHGNVLGRVTIGAEVLGNDFDFRANGYLGLGQGSAPSLTKISTSGGNIFVHGGMEEALSGVDAEVGWRLPVFSLESNNQIRANLGAYHFGSQHQSMTGGRLRLDLSMADIEALSPGARLNVSSSVQYDEPRGVQGFFGVSLTIPIGGAPASAPALTPLQRRMTQAPRREVSVLSAAGAFAAPEVAMAGGLAVTYLDGSLVSGADLQSLVDAAGPGSTVVLAGDFTRSSVLQLQPGQTVYGGGQMAVSTRSGQSVTVALSGASLTSQISGNTAAVALANDSTLSGLVINAANPTMVFGNPIGVHAFGTTNATIRNNTIRISSDTGSAFAIRVGESTNTTIENNTVHAEHTAGGYGVGIQVYDSTATIRNNSATVGTAGTPYTYWVGQVGTTSMVVLPGSTGNAGTGGTCYSIDSGFGLIGVVELVDGTTCP